ncbi:MAG: hypothetical protein QXS51_01495 [Thermoproteota archaeon]|nr:hypothetical protein [Candidatus Brockarchaeota archaeon]
MLDEARETTEIIFDLIKLRKVNPWDIKISSILRQLSKELREKGYMQFTLSGLLLLASSIVYLRKTETLLSIESDEEEASESEEIIDVPLEALERISTFEVPLRPSQPIIDLEQLVKALLKMLEKEYSKKTFEEEEPLPPIVPQQDEFMRDIEKKVEEFKRSLVDLISNQGKVSLRYLLEGKQPLEVARTFILILFVLSEPGFDIVFEGGEYYVVFENGFERAGV